MKGDFTYDDIRNRNSQVKEALVNIVNKIYNTDLSSIKVIASTLSELTQNTHEITRNSAVNIKAKRSAMSRKINFFSFFKKLVVDQCLKLMGDLVTCSKTTGLYFIQQAANKIVDSLANVLIVKIFII